MCINSKYRYALRTCTYIIRKSFHGQTGDHIKPGTQKPPAGELLAEHAVRHHVVGQFRGHARSRTGQNGPTGYDPSIVGHHVRYHKVYFNPIK